MARGMLWVTMRAVLLALAGGAAFGAASSLVNATRAPWARAVSDWVTNGAYADEAWCLVAFLGGLLVAGAPLRRWTSLLLGTVGGTLTLEVALVAYYLTDAARGVYAAGGGGVHGDWVWNDVRVWTQIGLVIGLALGLCGAVTRRGGPLRWWAMAALPLTSFARDAEQGTLARLLAGGYPATAIVLVVAGLLGVVGLLDVGRHLLRLLRRPRDREPLAAG